MLLGREAVVALGPEVMMLDIVVAHPCRPARRRAAGWEFAPARRRAPRRASFPPPRAPESRSSTARPRPSALAPSPPRCSSWPRRSPSRPRCGAPARLPPSGWRRGGARRARSAVALRRGKPRRASARSNASGCSRIHLMSCMTEEVRCRRPEGWKRSRLCARIGAIHAGIAAARGMLGAMCASFRRIGLGLGRLAAPCRPPPSSPRAAPTRSSPRRAASAATRATSWLSTSGGVRIAAITKAPTMK